MTEDQKTASSTPAPAPGADGHGGVLIPGDTCWRVEMAGRAAVLVDGAQYFSAVRQALLAARRRIVIMGWDIHSHTMLVPGAEARDEGVPGRLDLLLRHVASINPDIEIRLLLWDYSVLYAFEREPLPELNLGWRTPPQIEVILDDVLPLGASHHQKVVVVDDKIAFSGGLDLTVRRWDRRAHRPDDPDRIDPVGRSYAPFHDVQIAVDGAAARALAELASARWHAAAGEPLAALEDDEGISHDDPWPDDLHVDFRNVGVGIARTIPALHARPETREVRALYLAAIQSAEHSIYIENQYLTAEEIASALAARLQENTSLELVIVTPRDPGGWIEERTMGVRRNAFLRRLAEADADGRLRLVYPVVGGDASPTAVLVHSKVMIVDDRYLHVGSANLSRRSMGFDTECDLAIEARNEAERDGIARIRNGFLAEHLGVDSARIAEHCDAGGSLCQAIDRLAGGGRQLKKLDIEAVLEGPDPDIITEFADPERPIPAPELALNMFDGEELPELGRRRHFVFAGIAFAVIGALAVAWRHSPLADYADPAALSPLFEALRVDPWAPLWLVAGYVVAELFFFPLVVLIAVTAATFGFWLGALYALLGSMAAAIVTYGVGWIMGRGFVRKMMGERMTQLSQALGRRGFFAVFALRVTPVAPFTVVNLVCGASHIRFMDYVLANFFGLLPGILALSAAGESIRAIVTEPTVKSVLGFAAAIAAWLAVGYGFQRLAERWRRARAQGNE